MDPVDSAACLTYANTSKTILDYLGDGTGLAVVGISDVFGRSSATLKLAARTASPELRAAMERSVATLDVVTAKVAATPDDPKLNLNAEVNAFVASVPMTTAYCR
jgi:hypothetical protein